MSHREQQIAAIVEEIRACQRCVLSRTRELSVPGEGNLHSEILFIGEGPGANENRTGRPFVGAAGKFLDELIRAAGLERKDVYITNVVKCRPPGNRDPLPEELFQCGGYLKRQLEIIDPLVVITLGRVSMANYFPFKKISAIHGKAHWIDGRMVIPMFHPAAALHQPALKDFILEDFRKIPGILEEARRRKFGEEEEDIPEPPWFADEAAFPEPPAFAAFAENSPEEKIQARPPRDEPPEPSQLSLF